MLHFVLKVSLRVMVTAGWPYVNTRGHLIINRDHAPLRSSTSHLFSLLARDASWPYLVICQLSINGTNGRHVNEAPIVYKQHNLQAQTYFFIYFVFPKSNRLWITVNSTLELNWSKVRRSDPKEVPLWRIPGNAEKKRAPFLREILYLLL